ncbi:MAG: hypothetical protein ACXAC6_11340 [Candidatus Hodarchaeales archaeon]
MSKTQKHLNELKPLFDNYLQEKSASNLIQYLKKNSNLPGRRANLELAQAFTNIVDELSPDHHGSLTELTDHFCAINSVDAPTNSSKEFIPFCGTWALGIIGSKDEQKLKRSMGILNRMAMDPRWRVREATAKGISLLLKKNSHLTLQILNDWIKMENWLVYRAIAAGLASPSALKDRTVAIEALELHDAIFHSILSNPNNRNDDFKVLRKGLAYTFSVIVVEVPDEGFTLLKSLANTEDKDIRWIIKENLKKNRLTKAFKVNVQQVLVLLKSN